MYKVSVIIPMYNAHTSIMRLLRNLSEQTFYNVEYIIVDDGSTDNSYSIVKKYIEMTHDDRFRLCHQENKGVSSARNYGLLQATGEYIIFIDADDKINKSFINNYLHKIASNNADIAMFPINIISSIVLNKAETVINNYFSKSKHITAKQLLSRILTGDISTYLFGFIFRRSLWKNIIFNEKVSYKEDYLVMCKILLGNANCKIIVGNEAEYWYCDNNFGLSGKYTNKRVEDGLYVSKSIAQRLYSSQLYGLAVGACLVAELEGINYSIDSNNDKLFKKYSNEYLRLFKKASFSSKEIKIKRQIQYFLLKLKLYKAYHYFNIVKKHI